MLIELPVLLEDEDSGVVIETSGMFKVSNIELVIQSPDSKKCEIHTVGGDIIDINMSYKETVRYWYDALETAGGLFLAKRSKSNLN